MVTIIDCYHKANWIGHPVKVKHIIYLFVGFSTLSVFTPDLIRVVLAIRKVYHNGCTSFISEGGGTREH